MPRPGRRYGTTVTDKCRKAQPPRWKGFATRKRSRPNHRSAPAPRMCGCWPSLSRPHHAPIAPLSRPNCVPIAPLSRSYHIQIAPQSRPYRALITLPLRPYCALIMPPSRPIVMSQAPILQLLGCPHGVKVTASAYPAFQKQHPVPLPIPASTGLPHRPAGSAGGNTLVKRSLPPRRCTYGRSRTVHIDADGKLLPRPLSEAVRTALAVFYAGPSVLPMPDRRILTVPLSELWER